MIFMMYDYLRLNEIRYDRLDFEELNIGVLLYYIILQLLFADIKK
jgi:hypothetical protein